MSTFKVQDTNNKYYPDKPSEDEVMFYMANLLPQNTGLKYPIWYSAKVPGQDPGIKVDLKEGNALSIRIEDHEVEGAVDKIHSKDLKKIFKWIDLNKAALLCYWNEANEGKIDTATMISLLNPVE